jgi:carbonic anhydrase
MVSGSDRACEHWRNDYRVDGIDELELHHLCRAMSWLGEELTKRAWSRGQHLRVHGWVYSPVDGLITDLSVAVSRQDEVERLCPLYRA